MPARQENQPDKAVSLWPSQHTVWKLSVVLGLLILTQTLGFQLSTLRPWWTDDESAFLPTVFSGHANAVAESDVFQSFDIETIFFQALPRFDIDPFGMPESFQQKVWEQIRAYAVVHRLHVQEMLERGASYVSLIKRLLLQYNLPPYFAYIPLAESGFQADVAHPESGAAGLWQLMPETARAYGLQVSSSVDERLDPFLATQAAVRYLAELQEMFGRDTPLLILAAYNYGENNLSKAIVRARTRDIWSLMRKRQIPFQTSDYLMKMVSLWIITAQAERLGISAEPALIPAAMSPFTEIMFTQPTTVKTVARQIDLSERQIRSMNPHLLKAEIPPHTRIRIPPASVDAFSRFEMRLTPTGTRERCCARLVVVADSCWHTVEEGETPFAIARRYGMNLGTFKHVNQLQGANPIIRPGQRLTVCDAAPTSMLMDPKLW